MNEHIILIVYIVTLFYIVLLIFETYGTLKKDYTTCKMYGIDKIVNLNMRI